LFHEPHEALRDPGELGKIMLCQMEHGATGPDFGSKAIGKGCFDDSLL
jgi:hypothetical protein